MVTIKQAEQFHKNRKQIDRVVLTQAKKNKSVVYGGHALNHHLPPHLDRHTEDYDILTTHPQQSAKSLEKKLDRKYGGDLFYVKPAQHPGTFKVMNRVTNKEVADYTKKEKNVTHVKSKRGVRYVGLSHIKKGLIKTLKDKESSYRHPKDRDALLRIKILESKKKSVTKRRGKK
jgi:hypothetical protein